MIAYRGYKLPRDLLLLANLFLLLTYYSVLLLFIPVPKLIEAARRNLNQEQLREARADERVILDKMWRGCGFILSRIYRSDKPCLRRSLVLHRWCCRRNIDAALVIGFIKNGRELKGHSWLLLNGQPFGERAEDLLQYIPLIGEEQND